MADKAYLSSKDYTGHYSNIDKLNAGSMTLSAVQFANPNIPIYKDGVTGKYTGSPTANYPKDIKTWYNTNSANDVLGKKYIGQWPYNGNGSLTKAGYEKFKSEVVINKPVAVDRALYATENRKPATSNVVHDIAQLDSDIRDSRIKATMLISHRLKMTEKFTTSGSPNAFKPETTYIEKQYYNALNLAIKATASITKVGGIERIERQKDPENKVFSSYNKLVSSVTEKGKDVPPKNLTAEELDSSVPQPGEVIEHSGQSNESEATFAAKLEVAKSAINDSSEIIKSMKDASTTSVAITTDGFPFSGNTKPTVVESEVVDKSDPKNTQSKTGSTVSTIKKEKMFDKWRQHPGGTPRDNMLHYFASYNTQFDLFLMNPTDYNHINQSIAIDKWNEQLFFDFTKLPERLLISSSGVRTDHTKKGSSSNRYFADRDYFIDNVAVESYVAPGKKSGGAKYTNCNLEIFEPYGSTLLENLIRATNDSPIEGETYLDMPYMLRIKFNGYDETGEKLNTRIPTKANELPPNMRGETVYSQNDYGVKYLMLKIGKFNFKVSNEGTTYQIEFYNYNSFALEDYGGMVSSNLQVNSTTLGQFFGLYSGGNSDNSNPDIHGNGITAYSYETQHYDNQFGYVQSVKSTPAKKIAGPIQGVGDTPQYDTQRYLQGIPVKSYSDVNEKGEILNSDTGAWVKPDGMGHRYQEGPPSVRENPDINSFKPKTLVKKGTTQRSFDAILNSIEAEKCVPDPKTGYQAQEYADTYNFKFKEGLFDRTFLDKRIAKPDSFDINHVPVFNNLVKATSPYIANWTFGMQEGFETAFQIPAGKSIMEVIHAVISSSTFMTDQVETVTMSNVGRGNNIKQDMTIVDWKDTKDQPIIAYKVTPIVHIGKWDRIRKTYQKHYTYIIALCELQGETETDMGKYAVTDVCKQYDYMYTGTNRDVLEFDLNFDAAYYETNVIGGWTSKLAGQTSAERTKKATLQRNADAFASAFVTSTKNVRTNQTRWMPGSASDFQVVKAQNLMTRIYNTGADRLAGELTIIGDPDFIVQDEGFNLEAFANHYSPNGSISTHKQPIILINFLTPIDINSKTGTIFNPNDLASEGPAGRYGTQKPSTSVFSGFYKIMNITSAFEGGTFQQVLRLVRVQNQEYDYPEGKLRTAMGDGAVTQSPFKHGVTHDKSLLRQLDNTPLTDDEKAANKIAAEERLKMHQHNIKHGYDRKAVLNYGKQKPKLSDATTTNVKWTEGPASQYKRELPITQIQSSKSNVTGVLPPGLKDKLKKGNQS